MPITNLTISNKKQIYIVNRGYLDIKNLHKEESIYKLDKDGEKKELISKKTEKNTANFGGCLHYMVFMSSLDIELLDLTFFGPCKKNGNYDVHVQVLKNYYSNKKFPEVIYKKTFGKVFALQNCLFTIDLPEPIYIHAGIWYAIAFELNGPDTGKIVKPITQVTINLEGYNRAEEITFDFFMESSQLPQFSFQLPEYKEILIHKKINKKNSKRRCCIC